MKPSASEPVATNTSSTASGDSTPAAAAPGRGIVQPSSDGHGSKTEKPTSFASAPGTGDIRDPEIARLKAVIYQTRLGLDTGSHSVAELHRVTRRLPLEDRSEFDAAYAQVRAREVALRASILAASSATASGAAAAQQQVADAYEAYARAVTVAEATAKASRANALATNR